MSAPSQISRHMGLLVFLIELEGRAPQYNQLSATKQRYANQLHALALVEIRMPELYPSTENFVFITDLGKSLLKDIITPFDTLLGK